MDAIQSGAANNTFYFTHSLFAEYLKKCVQSKLFVDQEMKFGQLLSAALTSETKVQDSFFGSFLLDRFIVLCLMLTGFDNGSGRN